MIKPWHVKSKEIEEELYKKITEYVKREKLPRRNETKDIFNRVLYIAPEDVETVNWVRKTPVSIFNPGAVIKNKKLLVFPRIIYGYYYYSSCVGLIELDIEKVLERDIEKPILTKIIMYPEEPWEMALGCEDPRVELQNNTYYILYTAVAHPPDRLWKRPVVGVYGYIGLQALALMDLDYNVKFRGYFKIKMKDKIHIPSGWRDSAFLKIGSKESTLLTRPSVKGIDVCWKGVLNMEELTLDVESLEPNLFNEEWEAKIGWSTNAVKISKNEYLVGWHGVSNNDGFYREGLAIVDEEGKLLAITPHYVLEPRGLNEIYGDRPGVIFGNGLVTYKDLLIWVGGVSDHIVGIFITEMDKALENLVWLKKS